MKIEIIILAFAILSTGLMAGIFFTWSNAVKPGIGKLSDKEYLKALQSMNRVILNIPFKIIFFISIISVAFVPVLYFDLYPNMIFWIFIFTLFSYWVGAFGVTLFGNIPLNEKLDKTNLESISSQKIKFLRTGIESNWNNLNLIRTISSLITFILLISSLILLNHRDIFFF
jgi:uncharacterized membrane protein